jgi:hypothetical protein
VSSFILGRIAVSSVSEASLGSGGGGGGGSSYTEPMPPTGRIRHQYAKKKRKKKCSTEQRYMIGPRCCGESPGPPLGPPATRRLSPVRCGSAGAERREGGFCVAPACQVSPRAKKRKRGLQVILHQAGSLLTWTELLQREAQLVQLLLGVPTRRVFDTNKPLHTQLLRAAVKYMLRASKHRHAARW